jgi:DNA-3-methyladenine glycosylase I
MEKPLLVITDKPRCFWANPKNQIYVKYHDEEWGVLNHDDDRHFEFLILEAAQAGLSWETILNRREGYRKAFAGFDAKKVARFSQAKVEKLMQDTSIIRNRLKIESSVGNAKGFLAIQKEFGSFDKYLQSFVGKKPIIRNPANRKQIVGYNDVAVNLSKDLKKRGFKFLGPTVMYAHLQAVGYIQEHIKGCWCVKRGSRA